MLLINRVNSKLHVSSRLLWFPSCFLRRVDCCEVDVTVMAIVTVTFIFRFFCFFVFCFVFFSVNVCCLLLELWMVQRTFVSIISFLYYIFKMNATQLLLCEKMSNRVTSKNVITSDMCLST